MKPRLKVLIIEDDESIAEAIGMALTFDGFEIKVVIQATQAISAVKTYKPDAIVLDLLLSGIDGRDIAKALKNNTKTKNIPIILTSAHPLAEKAAQAAGADAFIAKPFDISVLSDKIKTLTALR